MIDGESTLGASGQQGGSFEEIERRDEFKSEALSGTKANGGTQATDNSTPEKNSFEEIERRDEFKSEAQKQHEAGQEEGKHIGASPFDGIELPEGIEVAKASVPVEPLTTNKAFEILINENELGGKMKRAGWRTSQTTGAKPASQRGEDIVSTPVTPPAESTAK